MKRICIIMIMFFLLDPSYADDGAVLKSVDFVDADPVDVARVLAEEGGFGLVVGSGGAASPMKKVTVRLRDIDCLDAIKKVLRAAGLKFMIDGSIITVSGLPKDVAASAFDEDSLARAAPQVLIECRVVEVSESGMRELGFKWGRETGKLRFAVDDKTGSIGLSEDITMLLSALVSRGEAEILAQPSVVSVSGGEASINIGSRVPYAVPASVNSNSVQWTVQYIDAGVSLKIIPRVIDEGVVGVSFRPEVSSISEWRATTAGEFPVITTRNAESNVKIRDGDTLVIGGLINSSSRENASKIFLLGDIPIFGELFRGSVEESVKTEVIFTLTPRIL